MKTTTSVPKNYLKCGLYALIFLLLSLPTLAQDKEFAVLHKNGKPYRIGKFVSSFCGKVLQITTFDENGNLIRQDEWQNKKRCGFKKIYDKDKKLVKEVKYRNNAILSYITYYKGQVYTQISEDRSIIISRGKNVVVRWKTIYQPIGTNRIAVMTKNQLIDVISKFLTPEEVVSTITDISKDFDGKKIPEADAYLSCGGSSSAIKADANLTSTDAKEKQKITDIATEVGNTCAANARSGLTSSFNGATGSAAEKGRIDKARQSMDKIIANCNESKQGGKSSGWISYGSTSLPPPVDPTIPEGEPVPEIDGAPVEEEPEEPKITRWSVKKVLETAAIVALGGIIFTAAAPSLPVLALASGTAAVLIVVGGSSAGGGTNVGGGVSRPDPDATTQSACEKLKNFKDYCDKVNWQDAKCTDAAQVLSGCGGDIREMFVAPDGSASGVGCGAAFDAAELERRKCAAKGMVARPEPGGNLCQTTGPMDGVISDGSEWYTDPNPMRGELKESFSGTSFKVVNTPGGLSDALTGSKQTTMVVFMDPDCPSCKNYTQSLNSADAQNAIKSANVQVVVVDASLSTQLMAENNIRAFPTTMIVKNGVKTLTAIGSMNPKETAKFVSGL